MSEGYRNIPMQRGRLVERDALGEVQGEGAGKREKWVNFEKAFSWVKVHQPCSPMNPVKPFARELRIAILDRLKLETHAEFNKVRLYTSIGSALDFWHHTDAVIEIDAVEAKGVPGGRITIGVTTRDKEGEQVADVEVWLPRDGLDEMDKTFDNGIQEVAKAVIARLRGDSSQRIVDLHIGD